MQASTEQMKCPQCDKTNPKHENEISWCAHCNWNLLESSSNEEHGSIAEQFYKKLGKKISQNIFDELKNRTIESPRFKITKFLTFCIAAVVHSIWIGFFALAIYLVQFWPEWICMLGSLICLAVVFFIRPVSVKFSNEVFLSRKEAPELYKLVDSISQKLGGKKINQLTLNATFNAYYLETGYWPFLSRQIGLGNPLIACLSKEELVALIAHEISHGINGDGGRRTFVSAAVRSLDRWHLLLHPSHWLDGSSSGTGGRRMRGQGIEIIAVFAINAARLVLAQFPYVLRRIMTLLMFHDSQEAEYLADHFAVNACGQEAMISMLRKFHTDLPNFKIGQRKSALSSSETKIFDYLRQRPYKMSDHEVLRLFKLEEHQGLGFDHTHPPTSYRIAFVANIKAKTQRQEISDQQFSTITEEITKYNDQFERLLRDQYSAYLHGLR